MSDASMHMVDIVILVVMALSAIVGFLRGFLREVLSLAAWVGAAWVALTFFSDAEAYVSGYLENPLAISVVAGGGLFIVALVVLMIVARLLSSGARKVTILGPVDRTLGLGFGLVRGAVFLGLAYLFTVQLVSDGRTPEWARDAKLLPYVETAAEVLEALIPVQIGRAERILENPQDILEGTGYTPDINRQIPNLIESELPE